MPSRLRKEIDQYNSTSPEITGGDVDADWQDPADGEEAVGGSVATPDQDIVEQIGQALGITYQDNEPLDPGHKVEKRDDERWEMNPASADNDPAAEDV